MSSKRAEHAELLVCSVPRIAVVLPGCVWWCSGWRERYILHRGEGVLKSFGEGSVAVEGGEVRDWLEIREQMVYSGGLWLANAPERGGGTADEKKNFGDR